MRKKKQFPCVGFGSGYLFKILIVEIYKMYYEAHSLCFVPRASHVIIRIQLSNNLDFFSRLVYLNMNEVISILVERSSSNGSPHLPNRFCFRSKLLFFIQFMQKLIFSPFLIDTFHIIFNYLQFEQHAPLFILLFHSFGYLACEWWQMRFFSLRVFNGLTGLFSLAYKICTWRITQGTLVLLGLIYDGSWNNHFKNKQF